MTKKLLKLAKILRCFTELQTDTAILISDSDIQVGSEVFVENEDGELINATDGEYEKDNLIYVVENGFIKEIREKDFEITEVEQPKEDEMAEEPKNEETEEPITEEVDEEKEALKAENETLKQEIETLKAEIEELKKELEKPVAEAIEKEETEFKEQPKKDTPMEHFKKVMEFKL